MKWVKTNKAASIGGREYKAQEVLRTTFAHARCLVSSGLCAEANAPAPKSTKAKK